MIREYLTKRKEMLEELIKSKQERFEHNQIIIVETNNKINELKNSVDEASEMFSVKAREDCGFNRHEIEDMEIKIAAYVSENKDIQVIIDDTQDELEYIERCLKEYDDLNVSRETFTGEEAQSVTNKIDMNKVIKQLQFCKSISKVDGIRTELEIENIIKSFYK